MGVLLFLAAQAQAGPGLLGTKTDVAPTAAGSPVGVMALVQMAVAVAIVVGLIKFALPRLLGKVTKATNDGEIVVEATAAVGPGTVHLVRTRGRTLLLGTTQNGITCLADVTEDSPIRFDEALAEATIDRPQDDLAVALARLQALEK